MLSKDELIESIVKEITIIEHLFTKIPDGKLDYRPTQKQRSMRELLQYLSQSPAASVKAIHAGNQMPYREVKERAKDLDFDAFDAAMEEQCREVRQTIESMNHDELEEEVDIFNTGKPSKRRRLLVEMTLKNLVGYKMQLFLYIKASGNEEIGTMNVWHGFDMPIAQE